MKCALDTAYLSSAQHSTASRLWPVQHLNPRAQLQMHFILYTSTIPLQEQVTFSQESINNFTHYASTRRSKSSHIKDAFAETIFKTFTLKLTDARQIKNNNRIEEENSGSRGRGPRSASKSSLFPADGRAAVAPGTRVQVGQGEAGKLMEISGIFEREYTGRLKSNLRKRFFSLLPDSFKFVVLILEPKSTRIPRIDRRRFGRLKLS